MTKTILSGGRLPPIPWYSKPQGRRDIVWGYPRNLVIPQHAVRLARQLARLPSVAVALVALAACAQDSRESLSQASGPPPDPCTVAADYTYSMIDDFETRDVAFVFNDARGDDKDPILEGTGVRDVSTRCGNATNQVMHVDATGSAVVTDWGRQYYHSYFHNGASDPFDASAFEGISFWIRRASPGGGDALLTFLGETYTDVKGRPDGTLTVVNGGTLCDGNTTVDSQKCDPFIEGVGISDDWRFITVPFSDMNQKGYGVRAPRMNTADIHAVGFQITAGSWDFLIDDLAYYTAL